MLTCLTEQEGKMEVGRGMKSVWSAPRDEECTLVDQVGKLFVKASEEINVRGTHRFAANPEV